jgi:Type II CAAX prenyl endopeptidase Rce1-like
MSQAPRGLLGRIAAGAVSFTVLTYVLALGVAIGLVTSSQFAGQLENIRVHFFTGAFFIYPIITPIPVDLLLLTDTCIIIYAACFLAAFRSKDGFLSGLQRLRQVGKISFKSSWLVAMPLVSCALLLVVLVATIVLSQSGLPSGTLCNPCPPQAELYAALTYSPISEEIAFRITTLGLLVAIMTIWKNRSIEPVSRQRTLSLVVASFLSPETSKARVGLPTITANGRHGIHWSEWILLLLASSLFGIAHIISGGTGWEIGKAFTAAISGFALGLVYLGYGAYAAILLHWFFDFYFETFSVGADVFGGAVATLPGLVSLASLIVGIVSILVALAWLVRRLTRGEIPTTYKPPESAPYSVQ